MNNVDGKGSLINKIITCSTPQDLFELTGLGLVESYTGRRGLKKNTMQDSSRSSSIIIFFCCNATVLRKLPGTSESLVCVVDLSLGFATMKK